MISIILPTYNRGHLLPEAFQSIKSQTFTDWELILVDDGSSDDTQSITVQLEKSFPKKLRHLRQENTGAYSARKSGLDVADGEFIAFYDSDDLWLPHHLESCVEQFMKHPEVDWIAARDKQIRLNSDDMLHLDTIPVQSLPDSLVSLESRHDGDLQIFTDQHLVETIITTEHSCGFQRSLIRKSVFEKTLFRTDQRNGEDRMFLIRALKNNFKLAYLNQCNLIYRIHGDNSSNVAEAKKQDEQIRVLEAVVTGYQNLFTDCELSRREQRALRMRISDDIFWLRGYNCYWQNQMIDEALNEFERAIRINPYNLRFLKTYLKCRLLNSLKTFRSR